MLLKLATLIAADNVNVPTARQRQDNSRQSKARVRRMYPTGLATTAPDRRDVMHVGTLFGSKINGA